MKTARFVTLAFLMAALDGPAALGGSLPEQRDGASVFPNLDDGLHELARQLVGRVRTSSPRVVIMTPRPKPDDAIAEEFGAFAAREIKLQMVKAKHVIVLEGDEKKVERLREMQAQNLRPSMKEIKDEVWLGMMPPNLVIDGDVYVIGDNIDLSMHIERLDGHMVGGGRVKIAKSAVPDTWLPHAAVAPPPSGAAGTSGNPGGTTSAPDRTVGGEMPAQPGNNPTPYPPPQPYYPPPPPPPPQAVWISPPAPRTIYVQPPPPPPVYVQPAPAWRTRSYAAPPIQAPYRPSPAVLQRRTVGPGSMAPPPGRVPAAAQQRGGIAPGWQGGRGAPLRRP